MPLFRVEDTSLVQYQRQPLAMFIEADVEALLWDNLEELTGDNLFRVQRQPVLPGGNRPDIVALDETGRVVVIEVKRSFDRGQLAQVLEYAGWARTTSLDELARMYHGGEASFWPDWADFTGAENPVLVNRRPLLYLAAREFDARTYDALAFLKDSQVPVVTLTLTTYLDPGGARIVHVPWAVEPEFAAIVAAAGDLAETVIAVEGRDFREVTLAEVAADLETPIPLVWVRPRKGDRYAALLRDDARIELSDGRDFATPSGAAMAAATVVSYDGWYAWRVGGDDGPTLNDLRHKIADATP